MCLIVCGQERIPYAVYFDTYRHDIDDLEDYNMMKAREACAFQVARKGTNDHR